MLLHTWLEVFWNVFLPKHWRVYWLALLGHGLLLPVSLVKERRSPTCLKGGFQGRLLSA